MTNAAGAAVSCAVKYGGRPAVFVKREELNEIKLKISSMPKAWIGKKYFIIKRKQLLSKNYCDEDNSVYFSRNGARTWK